MNKNIKNYIILMLIIIITCILFIYIFSWCKQYKDAQKEPSILIDTIPEVKFNNLDTILKERNFIIIYVCSSTNKSCNNFSYSLKKLIENENLNNDIVYLNISNESNKLEEIYTKYKSDNLIKKANNYPIILVFSNEKLIDFIGDTKYNKLTIDSVKDFLEGYGLIND